jgi:hypothetical protein
MKKVTHTKDKSVLNLFRLHDKHEQGKSTGVFLYKLFPVHEQNIVLSDKENIFWEQFLSSWQFLHQFTSRFLLYTNLLCFMFICLFHILDRDKFMQ